MQEEVRLIREHLFESDKLAQRLSSSVSNAELHASLAPFIDALRHSVLTAMRVAHMVEIHGIAVYGTEPH